jgi:L-glyceraldehyde 3-phosphate reductase
LTNKYLVEIPPGSRASKPHGFLRPEHITDEKLMQVRALNDLAHARGQSLAQMAIAWVLRHPEMTSALIGASSVAQIEENLKALDSLSFTAEEIDCIDRIVGCPE